MDPLGQDTYDTREQAQQELVQALPCIDIYYTQDSRTFLIPAPRPPRVCVKYFHPVSLHTNIELALLERDATHGSSATVQVRKWQLETGIALLFTPGES